MHGKTADCALRHDAATRTAATSSGERPLALIFDAYHATFGGNQRYICMLLAGDRNARWRFALACPGEGRLTEAARASGGEVHVVAQSARLSRGRQALLGGGLIDRILVGFALMSFNLRFLALLRRLRPAVLQVHSTRNALMVGFAARLAGIPMTLFIKGEMDSLACDRIAVALARRTFFLSRYLIPAWLERRRKGAAPDIVRLGIAFNEVDAAEQRIEGETPEGLVLEQGTVNFAFAGWLAPAKGVRELIDAFALAIRNAPACRLYILGTSSDEAFMRELRDRAARAAPAGTIHFLGWRHDVLDILAVMDAFVLPSFSEGIPRSIVESMALGKAVIATGVGGIPELLDDGRCGLEVPPGDAVSLAAAMARVAADPALRAELGGRARAEARSRYGFEDHVHALCGVLDRARA